MGIQTKGVSPGIFYSENTSSFRWHFQIYIKQQQRFV